MITMITMITVMTLITMITIRTVIVVMAMIAMMAIMMVMMRVMMMIIMMVMRIIMRMPVGSTCNLSINGDLFGMFTQPIIHAGHKNDHKKILFSHSLQTLEKFLRKKQFFSYIKYRPKVVLLSDYHKENTSKMVKNRS